MHCHNCYWLICDIGKFVAAIITKKGDPLSAERLYDGDREQLD